MELKLAGVALVVVGVPRNDCVWINADVLADGVDVGEHERAAVMFASAGTAASRRVNERRMVNGQNDRTLILIALDVLQLRCQESELVVGNRGPGWSCAGDGIPFFPLLSFLRLRSRTRGLTRDYSGIFKSIREESDDADVRSVEREVDAGLGYGSAMERSCFDCDRGGRRAEIPLEDRERFTAFGS